MKCVTCKSSEKSRVNIAEYIVTSKNRMLDKECFSTCNCGNRLVFLFHCSIFRNGMLFNFSFGKLYEIQSIITPWIDIINVSVYSIANHTKSD